LLPQPVRRGAEAFLAEKLSLFSHLPKMALGNLRGRPLSFVIGVVCALGFMLQGYDQAVANGLLTLDSFVSTFPQIDTLHTTGAQKSHNSTIQGACPYFFFGYFCAGPNRLPP
jgi:hypothetical protein